jgi:hypothetical protein
MNCVRSGGRRWSSSFRRRPEHAGRAVSKDALTIDLYGSERIIDRGGLPMRFCLALILLAAPLCAPLYESGALAQDATGLRPGITPDDAAVQGPRRAPVADDDSYAPLGIRAGGFILYPSLTVGTGYTTNAAGVAGGSGSGTATVTPEFFLQSDWARNEATLRLRGSYEKFLDGTTADNPSAAVDATGRIDLADDWAISLAGGYAYSQQALSDPDFPAGADKPPGVNEFRSSAALSGGAGPAKVTLTATADRTVYDDAIVSGSPVDQSYRDNTEYGARLRLGYEVSPMLTPFVEGEVTHRAFDQTLDHDGLERSSSGVAGRVGVALDRGPILTGEIAVGALSENFDDPTLATISALSVDGSLAWAPTELVTVSLNGATSINPSTDAASSGSVIYDGSVDLAYAWRRNVTLHGVGAIKNERFLGAGGGTGLVDATYQAGVSATWKMNRTAWLTAGYLHEWLASSDPARDYQSDAVRVELRMQH